MTDVPARVPLPDVLSTCPCPYRPSMHQVGCRVAVEFENTVTERLAATPLGTRHAGIMWQYPHEVIGRFTIEVGVDVDGIIRHNLERYREYVPSDEWEDWPKPMAFILEQVADQIEYGGVYFGGPRYLSRDSSNMDDLDIRGWTPADDARIEQMVASIPVVDPNQGTLPL